MRPQRKQGGHTFVAEDRYFKIHPLTPTPTLPAPFPFCTVLVLRAQKGLQNVPPPSSGMPALFTQTSEWAPADEGSLARRLMSFPSSGWWVVGASLIPRLLPLPGWDQGPAARQSRRTIPFFLELTSVHRSGEEVDESRGPVGEILLELWRHKSWPHHVSPSNKSLVCGPLVSGSERAGLSGNRARMQPYCAWQAGRLKWVPSEHPATPEALEDHFRQTPESPGISESWVEGLQDPPWGS